MSYDEAVKLFPAGTMVAYVAWNNRLVFGSVVEVRNEDDGARVKVRRGPGQWDYATPSADRVAVNNALS